MPEVTLEKASQKAKDLFNRGFVAMERGNLTYAIDMFSGCLREEPMLHKARKFLRAAEIKEFKGKKGSRLTQAVASLTGLPAVVKAQASLNSGKPLQALEAIEKVLRKDPLNMALIKVLGKAAEMAEEPEIAIQTLAMARENDPDNPQILSWLGELYLKTNQPRLGRECFEHLCEITPNDPAAVKSLKDAMAIDSMTKDGWSEAAATGGSFRKMMKDEKEAAILEKEAKAVKGQTDLEALIEENKARIQREPGNVNYRRALANLYASNKMLAEAIATLQDAQTVAGGRDPQIDQAISAIRLQEFEAEIKRLQESNLTAAAAAKQQERTSFLLRDIEERVARYPNDLQIKYDYGILLYQQNRINEAIQQFQAAQRNAQRRISAIYHLGLCFKMKHQYDMAIEQFERACEELPAMDDQKKAVLYELAGTLELTGHPAEALDHYKQIYQTDIGYRDVAEKVEHGYRKPSAQQG